MRIYGAVCLLLSAAVSHIGDSYSRHSLNVLVLPPIKYKVLKVDGRLVINCREEQFTATETIIANLLVSKFKFP